MKHRGMAVDLSRHTPRGVAHRGGRKRRYFGDRPNLCRAGPLPNPSTLDESELPTREGRSLRACLTVPVSVTRSWPRIREFHARISSPDSALKLVANGGDNMCRRRNTCTSGAKSLTQNIASISSSCEPSCVRIWAMKTQGGAFDFHLEGRGLTPRKAPKIDDAVSSSGVCSLGQKIASHIRAI